MTRAVVLQPSTLTTTHPARKRLLLLLLVNPRPLARLISVVLDGLEEVRDVLLRRPLHDAVSEVHHVLRVPRLFDRVQHPLGDVRLAPEQAHRVHVPLDRLVHPQPRARVRHVHGPVQRDDVRARRLEGRSKRSDVGVELKGVSWS
eukprot:12533-Pelagococcus_subviridis.AAC.1